MPLEEKKKRLGIPDDVDRLCRRQVESFRGYSAYHLEENFDFGPNDVLVRFQKGKMANLKNTQSFDTSQLVNVRTKAIAALMDRLYGEAGFADVMDDLDLIIPFSFSDMSTAPRQQIPTLTFSKEQNSNNIVIPSINNLVGYAEIEHVSMYDYPLLDKNDEACFVGSLTNIYWNGKGIAANQRLQLANYAKGEECPFFARVLPPKTYDEEEFAKVYAEVTEVFPNLASGEEFSQQKERVEIRKQLDYKYQLCVDGHVCAWARLPWQLYANCVPIKIRNPDFKFMEWYYPLLDFSKDCLEINMDQLPEVIEWLKNDPEEQMAISQRGKSFVQQYINPDLGQRILLWTILLLSEKQQLFLPELQ